MESVLMKVHEDFKKWCEDIKKKDKELTLVKITRLIIKHNAIGIIRGDILHLNEK